MRLVGMSAFVTHVFYFQVKALTPSQEITPMGRLLSKLPTDVHLGKFLLVATVFGCLDPALTIAAALNSKSPFVTPFGLEHDADKARSSFQSGNANFPDSYCHVDTKSR